MNVFIILSLLIVVIGVLLLVATPSVLFKLNWKEKTVKEKMLTFLIYLSSDTNTYAKDWGTTIYNKDLTFNSKVPYKQNTGFMFVPGEDTWHGVPKQYIFGVRRNLIINYVSSDWKSASELYKMN